MRQKTADGTQMKTLEEFYDVISKVLEFPEYFGRNLDALDECLDFMPEYVYLTITNSGEMLKDEPKKSLILEILEEHVFDIRIFYT